MSGIVASAAVRWLQPWTRSRRAISSLFIVFSAVGLPWCAYLSCSRHTPSAAFWCRFCKFAGRQQQFGGAYAVRLRSELDASGSIPPNLSPPRCCCCRGPSPISRRMGSRRPSPLDGGSPPICRTADRSTWVCVSLNHVFFSFSYTAVMFNDPDRSRTIYAGSGEVPPSCHSEKTPQTFSIIVLTRLAVVSVSLCGGNTSCRKS